MPAAKVTHILHQCRGCPRSFGRPSTVKTTAGLCLVQIADAGSKRSAKRNLCRERAPGRCPNPKPFLQVACRTSARGWPTGPITPLRSGIPRGNAGIGPRLVERRYPRQIPPRRPRSPDCTGRAAGPGGGRAGGRSMNTG
jgi:hypothetical protein